MKRRASQAFTVVELLVVVAIIALLVGLLLPAVNRARATARQAECINNQKQLATAVQTYFTTKGRMPNYMETGNGVTVDAYGWVHPLLPNLGQANLHDQILDGASSGIYVGMLVCPSDPSTSLEPAWTSYAPNAGRAPSERIPDMDARPDLPVDWPENGAFGRDLPAHTGQPPTINTIDMISRGDGAATTILLAENVRLTTWNDTTSPAYQAMWWSAAPLEDGVESDRAFAAMTPRLDQTVSPGGNPLLNTPSSRHDGGFVVAFCDNHVTYISDQISYSLFARMMTSNGARARAPGQAQHVRDPQGNIVPNPEWQGIPFSDADLQ